VKKINTILENRDIKAETLISIYDIKEEIVTQMEGVFFRNYSEDLMNVENYGENITATLSRDSIFHLLPEKLFFEDTTHKRNKKQFFDFTEDYQELLRKRREILSFFQPFDISFFKLSLDFEQKLNFFAETGNNFFQNFFLNDTKSNPRNSKPETDKYIAKLKMVLPFVSQIRGNLQLIADLLKTIFEVDKVEIKEIELFKKHFIIHKEGLSKDEYLTMDKELVTFFEYLKQWFLPVELKCDFRLKDYSRPIILGESLILEYNTNL